MKTNLHALMLMACSLAAIAPMEGQISLSHERNGYRIGEQPYLFNGKEYDSMHALNLYDYGFRSYDPALMSWTSVDPLASKYPQLSPYAYCSADPVNRIDMFGLTDILVWIRGSINS